MVELRSGFGRHIYIYDDPVVRAEKAGSYLREQYVFEIFFHTATTLSKFAMFVLLSLEHSVPADHPMTTISLAFYYRIFPILRFRRICIWVAYISLVYMVVIDFTVIFQWYVGSVSLLSGLKLREAVTQFTTLGTVSVKTFKATASTSMGSSSVAAPSMLF